MLAIKEKNMRIPKYIDEALRKRANAAFRFLQYDDVVSKFIEQHNIDVNSKEIMAVVLSPLQSV